jgi:hypothetical protein
MAKQKEMTGDVFDRLSDAEKRAFAAQYDRKIRLSESEPMTARERQELARQFAKRDRKGPGKGRGRPKVGRGAARVSVSIEGGMLKALDEYARRHGLSRSEVLVRGASQLMKAG